MDLYKGQFSNYVMKEYVLQTLFLKLTGCMEQKAKCIFWDIATHDFEFRYDFLKNINGKQGEYSNYASKNEVYKTLLQKLVEIDRAKKLVEIDRAKKLVKIGDAKKNELPRELKNFKENILEKSIAKDWLPRELRDLKIGDLFKIECWGKDHLFESSLQEIYNSLYEHRNRCAHNTLSYQGNVMNPQKIQEMGADNNYASWFTLLVLMDMIYMELYEEFTSTRRAFFA